MKTPNDWAEAAYDLVSIQCKDMWHMAEVRALFAECQAEARRAFVEDAARRYWEDARDHGLPRDDMTRDTLVRWLRALASPAAEPVSAAYKSESLQKTQQLPCATCGETGFMRLSSEPMTIPWPGPDSRVPTNCATCGGSGIVMGLSKPPVELPCPSCATAKQAEAGEDACPFRETSRAVTHARAQGFREGVEAAARAIDALADTHLSADKLEYIDDIGGELCEAADVVRALAPTTKEQG